MSDDVRSRIRYGVDARTFLDTLPDASVDLLFTSPPYWCQRVYGNSASELGVEPSVNDYIANMSATLHASWRVIKRSGWMVINIGDTYANQPGSLRTGLTSKVSASNQINARSAVQRNLAGLPLKSMAAVPERLKIAMIDLGWRCRNTVVWQKSNPLPTTAADRWNTTWEPIHCFARSERSYFRYQPTLQDIKGDVWRMATRSGKSLNHPAAMPRKLAQIIIATLSPQNGMVIDPFAGSGTVLHVAGELDRCNMGAELYEWKP
jgi:site-specific DNA-methyltransferase (adenine-specific)